MVFDIVLKEKLGTRGLTKVDAVIMFELLPDGAEAYPVEFYNTDGSESSAMGFITAEAAEELDYETDQDSPIAKHIGSILANMNLENESGEYEYQGLKIFLAR